MGGSNPYIEQIEVKTATESFAVTFHMPDETLEVQVDPELKSRTDQPANPAASWTLRWARESTSNMPAAESAPVRPVTSL